MEFGANRNVPGNPQIRICITWKSLVDWATFAESDVWRSTDVELRGFATNVRVELWGTSPVVSEPIRPASQVGTGAASEKRSSPTEKRSSPIRSGGAVCAVSDIDSKGVCLGR